MDISFYLSVCGCELIGADICNSKLIKAQPFLNCSADKIPMYPFCCINSNMARTVCVEYSSSGFVFSVLKHENCSFPFELGHFWK